MYRINPGFAHMQMSRCPIQTAMTTLLHYIPCLTQGEINSLKSHSLEAYLPLLKQRLVPQHLGCNERSMQWRVAVHGTRNLGDGVSTHSSVTQGHQQYVCGVDLLGLAISSVHGEGTFPAQNMILLLVFCGTWTNNSKHNEQKIQAERMCHHCTHGNLILISSYATSNLLGELKLRVSRMLLLQNLSARFVHVEHRFKPVKKTPHLTANKHGPGQALALEALKSCPRANTGNTFD